MFAKFFFSDTLQCSKQLPSGDPKVVLCVKNCTGFDPLLNQSFSLAFQENKPLIQDRAYTWKNENNEEITSITCDYKDLSNDKMYLDYNWTCNSGYYENGKFCSGTYICLNHLDVFVIRSN